MDGEKVGGRWMKRRDKGSLLSLNTSGWLLLARHEMIMDSSNEYDGEHSLRATS